MNNEIFVCKYSSGIEARPIRLLLAMSLVIAEIRFDQEVQERDGRYRHDEKARILEIDTSTAFGKTAARFFEVLIAELYVDDEYILSGTSTTPPRHRKARRRRS